jgi:glycogen synthase
LFFWVLDTIFEFNPTLGTGNGFTFESHQYDDLNAAIERALRVFRNEEQYLKLRELARGSVLDNSRVALAWTQEFCRLKQRMFSPPVKVEDQESGASSKGSTTEPDSK